MKTYVLQMQSFDVFSPALAHLHLRRPFFNFSEGQYFVLQRAGQGQHVKFVLSQFVLSQLSLEPCFEPWLQNP